VAAIEGSRSFSQADASLCDRRQRWGRPLKSSLGGSTSGSSSRCGSRAEAGKLLLAGWTVHSSSRQARAHPIPLPRMSNAADLAWVSSISGNGSGSATSRLPLAESSGDRRRGPKIAAPELELELEQVRLHASRHWTYPGRPPCRLARPRGRPLPNPEPWRQL